MCELLCFIKLSLSCSKLSFRAFALANVAAYTLDTHDHAILINQTATNIEGYTAAILGDYRQLEIRHPGALKVLCNSMAHQLHMIRPDNVSNVPLQGFRQGVTANSLAGS